jgi:hypothetical protein
MVVRGKRARATVPDHAPATAPDRRSATAAPVADATHTFSSRQSSLFIAVRRVPSGVRLEQSRMVFPRSVDLKAWQRIGEQLLAALDSSNWWLADWLAYGETAFRDRYREMIRASSLSYQTLRNYVWVARRYELSRRRDNLSFGHHAEVATLVCCEQEYWLRKAEEFGWSRNRLRAEVRPACGIAKVTRHHKWACKGTHSHRRRHLCF